VILLADWDDVWNFFKILSIERAAPVDQGRLSGLEDLIVSSDVFDLDHFH
jgi:hypothetical protein